jgi:hypothetical protein
LRHAQVVTTVLLVVAGLALIAGPVSSEGSGRATEYSPLLYSTFLGGGQVDWAHAIELGPDGSVYVAGYTSSRDAYTTEGAFQRVSGGKEDLYIVKMGSHGSTVEWATLVGGSGMDIAWGLAVGPDGAVYVTGHTTSTDFPTTTGALSPNLRGDMDAFVVCLAADGGSLRYSTYLGGEGVDQAFDVLVTDNGRAYVAGNTESQLFPTTVGAYDRTMEGISDAFLARLSPNGRTLEASTLLGGMYSESEPALAMDGEGDVWITGSTSSPDFPTSSEAHVALGLQRDVFITEFRSSLEEVNVSTVLGRERNDVPRSIDVSDGGYVLVGGFSSSSDFPNHASMSEPENSGQTDGLLIAMSVDLETIISTMLIGGGGFDVIRKAAFDQHGLIQLVGYTNSTDFPTTEGSYQGSGSKVTDDHEMFYMKVWLYYSVYSTLIGGGNGDFGMDMAIDPFDVPMLAGHSRSQDFPVVNGPVDGSYNGEGDIVVLRFTDDVEPPEFGPDLSTLDDVGYKMLFRADVIDQSRIGGEQVEYWLDDGDPVVIDIDPYSMVGAIVDVPSSTRVLKYHFIAWDVIGRINTTEVVTVQVPDTERPRVVEDMTPGNATTGDDLEFLVTLDDNRGVDLAYVECLLAEEWFNLSLAPLQNHPGSWNLTVRIPGDDPSPVPYSFAFVDGANLWNSSPLRIIGVVDDDPPVLGRMDLPVHAEPGSNVTIHVPASDNVAIVEAWLGLRTGPGDWTVVAIGPPYEPSLLVVLPVPSGHGDLIVELHATDAAANEVTASGVLPFSDRQPPGIIITSAPEKATTGDPYVVAWEARDPGGVDMMWLLYAFGEAPGPTEYLVGASDGGPVATMEVPVPSHMVDPLWVVLRARDDSGNVNETAPARIEVQDDEPPVALLSTEDLEPREDHMTAVLDGTRSTDNVGIVRYEWSWTRSGEDEVHMTSVDLSRESITFEEPGVYEIYLTVYDAAGNSDTTSVTHKAFVGEHEETFGYEVVALVVVAASALALSLAYLYLRRRDRARGSGET